MDDASAKQRTWTQGTGHKTKAKHRAPEPELQPRRDASALEAAHMTTPDQIRSWIRQLDAIRTALVAGPFSASASRALERADDMIARLQALLDEARQ